MTANQINFYKAKEEAKHWRRQDKESKRHNVSDEAIRTESNTIQEWWNAQQAAHLVRSDAINNAHYERQDAENQRHNKMVEIYDLNYLDTVAIPTAKAASKTAEANERNASTNAYTALGSTMQREAETGLTNLTSKYYVSYYDMYKARADAQNFSDYTGVIVDAVKTVLPQVRVNLSGGTPTTANSQSGINTSGRYSNYTVTAQTRR